MNEEPCPFENKRMWPFGVDSVDELRVCYALQQLWETDDAQASDQLIPRVGEACDTPHVFEKRDALWIKAFVLCCKERGDLSRSKNQGIRQ